MPLPYNQRTCYCGDVGTELIGRSAILAGWVQNRRDHGGMVFIDLRDRAGLVQLKFNPESDPDAHELSGRLRSEFCIVVRGDVAARPPEMVKKDMKTGAVEVEVRELEILSETPTPKFEIVDILDVSEELRLKYRYLDLRRGPMQQALRTRHRIIKTVRDHFDAEGFVEIETPILTKSTPEGARDYLVPSRVHPGTFFALPQSPQIFKQLLMISGFDKYVQIARCFRDEDLRADRQPEFTQLDMEMSFVQPEDVFDVIEGCMVRVMKAIHDVDMPRPFPRMTFAEAMRDFGTDAPDTRYNLKLIDLTGIAAKTEFAVFTKAIEAGGVVRAICVPGGADMSRKELDALVNDLRGIGAGGMPYVKVADEAGRTIFQTGAAKFFDPDAVAAVCSASGAKPGDAICFAADSESNVCRFLSWLRPVIARRRKLIPDGQWHFTWVVDMPMFEFNEEDQLWYSMHHPFTRWARAPHPPVVRTARPEPRRRASRPARRDRRRRRPGRGPRRSAGQAAAGRTAKRQASSSPDRPAPPGRPSPRNGSSAWPRRPEKLQDPAALPPAPGPGAARAAPGRRPGARRPGLAGRGARRPGAGAARGPRRPPG